MNCQTALVSVVGYAEFQGSKLDSEGPIVCFLPCRESRLRCTQVGHECRKGTMWGREGRESESRQRRRTRQSAEVFSCMWTLGLHVRMCESGRWAMLGLGLEQDLPAGMTCRGGGRGDEQRTMIYMRDMQ